MRARMGRWGVFQRVRKRTCSVYLLLILAFETSIPGVLIAGILA